MLKILTAVLCVGVASAAPWPFSMWRKSQGAALSNIPLPSFYHTTSAMRESLDQLKTSCDGLTVDTMKDNGVEIQVAKYIKPGESAKYKTMVVANEHARELITGEIALNFVQALCGQGSAVGIDESKKETEFLVVLNANPTSRSRVEKGAFCTRVNGNKVDINRNFDADYSETDKGDTDTNPGKTAFDQPESRILKAAMEKFQPHFYLDLHSGFRGMFFPNAVAQDAQLSTKLQRLFAPVDEATCQCPLGVANQEVGYHTAGSALDYSFQVLKVPVSMAVEVYLNEDNRGEIEALEARWSEEKTDLLKPIVTGSSFMQNGISANTIIPMNVIDMPSPRDLMESMTGKMHPDECMAYFNPVKKESFDKTLKSWTDAIVSMSIKSREIHPDAAHFAAAPKGTPALIQKKEPAQGEPPVWFALKVLGLLFIVYLVYVAIKYYRAKQSKSGEAAPLTAAQASPVQISD